MIIPMVSLLAFALFDGFGPVDHLVRRRPRRPIGRDWPAPIPTRIALTKRRRRRLRGRAKAARRVARQRRAAA